MSCIRHYFSKLGYDMMLSNFLNTAEMSSNNNLPCLLVNSLKFPTIVRSEGVEPADATENNNRLNSALIKKI